jgi:anaerobic selenocysteine-containing dehydrogenase
MEKFVRIRLLHYDWKYDKQKFVPWKMEACGKTLEPYLKTLLPPFGLAYKKRIYSPKRILYPLKRVDWDPRGDRKAENRGKSKYVRISWAEAAEIVSASSRR